MVLNLMFALDARAEDPWTRQLQLGRSLADQGRYQEARLAFEQAAAQARQAGSQAGLATALNNLGAVHLQLHEVSAAERYYRRSAAIWKEAGDFVNALGPTTNLAAVYLSRRQYRTVEALLGEALDVATQNLGSEHPLTGAILAYLAKTAFEKRDFDRAAALSRRTLEMERKRPVRNVLEIATAMGNLGAICRAQGNSAESSRLFSEAIATLQELNEPENPAWIRALDDAAGVQSDAGQYHQAEELLQRALGIAEKKIGPTHPRVARILYHYAEVLRRQNRGPEARKLVSRAAQIEQQSSRGDGSGYIVDFKSLSGIR